MLTSLDAIKKNAKEQFIDSAADILKHKFAYGANLFEEFSSNKSEVFSTLARMVGAAVSPTKKEDIEYLVKNHTQEILESCQEINESGIMSPDGLLADNGFYSALARGVQFIAGKEIINNQSELEDQIFVRVCEKMADELGRENLSDKKYILNLIDTTGCGWPLILAKGEASEDLEIILAAVEKDDWVMGFATNKE